MKRREFLQTTAATAAMLSCFPPTLGAIERDTTSRMEKRALGKTGEKLSILGFGSFVLDKSTPEQAAQWVREAYEAGINYFDVAPTYGIAEERLGPVLAPYRKNVFLACKTTQRSKNEANTELEQSLTRLRTDHVDLYQLHAVTTLAEVEQIFGLSGAIHAFESAKKAGKTRFLGFSAHSVESALALMDRYAFDTILFPVNYATWHAGNFGPQVLAKAQAKQMGILAIKALAKRPWQKGAPRTAPKCWYEPFTQPDEAMLALRFTLSHPVTAAVTPADEKCMQLALSLAPKFTPLSAAEAEAIKKNAMTQEPIFRYPRPAA
jgi:predicted aldo/keto reductase-like oxidoreductase